MSLHACHSDGFWTFAKEHLSGDLPTKKVRLAEAIGVKIADPIDGLWGDDTFMASELGQFLDFLWRNQ